MCEGECASPSTPLVPSTRVSISRSPLFLSSPPELHSLKSPAKSSAKGTDLLAQLANGKTGRRAGNVCGRQALSAGWRRQAIRHQMARTHSPLRQQLACSAAAACLSAPAASSLLPLLPISLGQPWTGQWCWGARRSAERVGVINHSGHTRLVPHLYLT